MPAVSQPTTCKMFWGRMNQILALPPTAVFYALITGGFFMWLYLSYRRLGVDLRAESPAFVLREAAAPFGKKRSERKCLIAGLSYRRWEMAAVGEQVVFSYDP